MACAPHYPGALCRTSLGSELAQRFPESVGTYAQGTHRTKSLPWNGRAGSGSPAPHTALTAALTVANSTTAVPAFFLESTRLSTSPYCGDKGGPAHSRDKLPLP